MNIRALPEQFASFFNLRKARGRTARRDLRKQLQNKNEQNFRHKNELIITTRKKRNSCLQQPKNHFEIYIFIILEIKQKTRPTY